VSWDSAYADGWAPWDIGAPQPAFVELAERGEFTAPVLDSGCGTGENSLMLAARGLDVTGIDIAPTAIERAQTKARRRGLTVRFEVGDVLALDQLGRRFGSVVDCGVFHTFDDILRPRYVESLAAAVVDGGVVHLLCFSDRVPGTAGPRLVSQAELRAAFADGWQVERIIDSAFAVKSDFSAFQPHAWLARIVRREPGLDRSR
jgi:cyclopropane fatty-acyl-phospholipid synthase-like methyltransferase